MLARTLPHASGNRYWGDDQPARSARGQHSPGNAIAIVGLYLLMIVAMIGLGGFMAIRAAPAPAPAPVTSPVTVPASPSVAPGTAAGGE